MSPSKLVSVMLSKNSTKKKVEVIISTVAKKNARNQQKMIQVKRRERMMCVCDAGRMRMEEGEALIK